MLDEALDSLRGDIAIRARYDNYIGGSWVPPVERRYFDNPSPIDGKKFCEIARSSASDIELALDAAHAAMDAWGKTSTTARAIILNKIADRMEERLDLLAMAAAWHDAVGQARVVLTSPRRCGR